AGGHDDGEATGVEWMAGRLEAHRWSLPRRPPAAQALSAARGCAYDAGMRLDESVVLVTGGASGLGEATVRMVVSAGGRAVILDRPGSAGEDLVRALGERTTFTAADVTSGPEVAAAVEHAVARFGKLHVAVNCAGVGAAMRTITKQGPMPLELFAKVIAINLTGT